MYTTTPYETTTTTAGTAALTGISIVVWLIYLAVIVFELVAMWKVFVKAGQPGWAAIIPIYNFVVLFQIIKMDWWHILIMLFVPCAMIVYLCIINYKLALAFGKDTGFAVLSIFFSAVTIPILAFGSAQYVG